MTLFRNIGYIFKEDEYADEEKEDPFTSSTEAKISKNQNSSTR